MKAASSSSLKYSIFAYPGGMRYKLANSLVLVAGENPWLKPGLIQAAARFAEKGGVLTNKHVKCHIPSAQKKTVQNSKAGLDGELKWGHHRVSINQGCVNVLIKADEDYRYSFLFYTHLMKPLYTPEMSLY